MSLANSAGLSQSQQETLRNHAIAAMALPDIRVAWDIGVSDPKRHGFTIDAAFERYAHKRDDGSVVVRRVADNHQLLELKGTASDGPTTVGEFSPSSRYLAMMTHDAQSTLDVWDLSDGRLILSEARISGSNTPTWAFHSDGRTLAYACVDGPIVFFDLIDGKPKKVWSDGLEAPIHSPSAPTDQSWPWCPGARATDSCTFSRPTPGDRSPVWPIRLTSFTSRGIPETQSCSPRVSKTMSFVSGMSRGKPRPRRSKVIATAA